MYLHEDRELFKEVVKETSELLGMTADKIEKDYYVTMILKLLAEKSELCVFKGGTSLSKCFHAIERFSEDIDITFSEHIGEARRKKLKYNILKSISEELHMTITNWDKIESDKDYNYYLFSYEPVVIYQTNAIRPEVKLETALVSYAFPTEIRPVESLLVEFLKKENADIIEEYSLQPFKMQVQSLSRTFVDKIFALCDYYMQGKSKRYSRHLYDLYKLRPLIIFNDSLQQLVKEVRRHRQKMDICPSADDSINIPALVAEFCENNFYKKDYLEITEYFITDPVSYEDAIENIKQIVMKVF